MATSNEKYQEPAALKRALVALKDMRSKLDAVERARTEPIAIIGMSCRFPGGANSPESFWKLLDEGIDGVTEVPADRWDVDAYYDPDSNAPGKMYVRKAGFIDQVDQFEPQFFGISAREATGMDPQHRMLLELTWEALESAGLIPSHLMGSQTGVYIGMSTNDYSQLQLRFDDLTVIDPYLTTGTSFSIAAGRLSYTLGLQGPTLTVDTACSSSLVAVHLACQSLRAGQSNLAMAGGVNLILSPDATIAMAKSHALSPDGLCKTFDASADGYGRAEGCGMVVLKRLSDATKDGDLILAVIRGSAVNHDGRSSGLTVPNGGAQQAVIRQALANAGELEPNQIGYVETHGTGTQLGDPIEVRALAAALCKDRPKDQPLLLGSVKSNIGHTEAASGMAGLIKMILALQHEKLPQQLHFKHPNPHIDWDKISVKVVDRQTEWNRGDSPRIVGISSFGISGTNSHIVLEEAPLREAPTETTANRTTHILPLSANNEKALRDLAGRYDSFLANHNDISLHDVTYTAGTARTPFAYRMAALGTTTDEIREQIQKFATGTEGQDVIYGHSRGLAVPQIAFLFTGQGSQYVNMAQQLYRSEPVFRAALDRCNEILEPHLERSLLSVIYPPEGQESPVNETAYTQPALFSIEYALTQLWQSWGIFPSVMLGHSVGEYVAACIAGVFSLEDGLKLIAARGRLMQSLPQDGAMAAVFTDRKTVMDHIAPYTADVSLAAVNGPQNIVISGRATAIDILLVEFARLGIKSSRLSVSHAFHSPLLEPILSEFETVATGIRYAKPKTGIISNLTGELVKDDRIARASYWRTHARQAVQFQKGMETLRQQGFEYFLEVGPQPTLIGMARQCLPEEKYHWLASIRQRKDELTQMLESLGTLFVHGSVIDWKRFYEGHAGQKISLPTYPFQRQRYWSNPAKTSSRLNRKMLHPLLGQEIHSPSLKGQVFETEVGIEFPSFLTDHRIYETAIFPATGYMEMAFAAAGQVFNGQQCSLENIVIREPLILPEHGTRTVQVAVTSNGSERVGFEIYSLDQESDTPNNSWRIHATGTIQPEHGNENMPGIDLDKIKATFPIPLPVTGFYEKLSNVGLNYGPAFQGIRQIWEGNGEVLGEVALASESAEQGQDYKMHPALLDACFQLLGAASSSVSADSSKVYVPVGFQSFKLHQTGQFHVWAHAAFTGPIINDSGKPKDSIVANLRMFDSKGELVAEVINLHLKQISKASIQRMSKKQMDEWLLEMGWKATPPVETMETSNDRRWLVFVDENGFGKEIASQLHAQGADCVLIQQGTEYCQLEKNHYQLDPTQRKHFDQLIAEVSGQGPVELGILHFWSLDNHFDTRRGDSHRTTTDLETAQEMMCGSILHLVQALSDRPVPPKGLWVITHGAQSINQAAISGVAQSSVWGLSRTIALEYPNWRFACIDLDLTGLSQAQLLFQEISSKRDDETQIALHGGQRYVARLEHHKPRKDKLDVPSNQPFELIVPTPGILDQLKLQPVERRAPQAGEVEIRVLATGLNFRDVLSALGMYPGASGPIGSEIAGTIVSVGKNVTDWNVGDEVLGIAEAAFRSFATLPVNRVFRKPENVTVTQASSIPIAFLTAHYGLQHLAGIKAGDRVLIHAAAGGVGLAAVQLAQQAEAEIFATAGSPEKQELLRSMGVQHIFSSRTLEFVDEINRITQGKGVNIVLNSLTDEFIPKSISILAEHGCFLEIGKRDDWDQAKVTDVKPTAIYHRYDLGTEIVGNRPLIREMLMGLLADFESGKLKPLPVRAFPIQEVREAFRFMAQARHIGKIVVTQKEDAPLIRPDGTYLITGGLGSLGLVTAQWLAERGAKHIVLMSRRSPDETIQRSLDELEQTHQVEIRGIACDVAQSSDVEKALTQIQLEMPPLRGIIHAAGVLNDGILSQQTWNRFDRVLAPKAYGAWNLHRLTQNQPLDFFIMFSSAASLLGSAGQSNYTSANGFLDGLAHYRRAQGLPATSINWGAWAEVGMAASLKNDGLARKSQEIESISPEDGMMLLEKLLIENPIQIGVLPVNWSRFRSSLNGKAVPSLWRELVEVKLEKVDNSPAFKILDRLKTTPPEQWENDIFKHVQQQVTRTLGFDLTQVLDPERVLTDLGIDSLMAVELKNKVDRDFDMNIPLYFLLEGVSVNGLSRMIFDSWNERTKSDVRTAKEKLEAGPPMEIGKELDPEKAKLLLANIDQLSEEQVDALLNNLLTEEDS